jgi:hypothetical protein
MHKAGIRSGRITAHGRINVPATMSAAWAAGRALGGPGGSRIFLCYNDRHRSTNAR